jgi:hypothetical protein
VLQYHFDRGLYMHEIVPGLFCGTQPRNPHEIEELSTNHGVTVIMNLQQDKDIQHWGVDFGANQHRANELGVTLLRKPVRSKEARVQGSRGSAGGCCGSSQCCCSQHMHAFMPSIPAAIDPTTLHLYQPTAVWHRRPKCVHNNANVMSCADVLCVCVLCRPRTLTLTAYARCCRQQQRPCRQPWHTGTGAQHQNNSHAAPSHTAIMAAAAQSGYWQTQ